MITLGLIALIVGYILGVSPLIPIGWVLLAVGLVLLLVGELGHPLGGRRWY